MLVARLTDEHPHVREHAVRLSEKLAGDSPDLRAGLCALADDPDVRVRYQLAFTLGELDDPARYQALATIARRDGGDQWIRLAVLSSLAAGAGELFAILASDKDWRASDGGQSMLAELARTIGRQNRREEVTRLLEALDELPADERELAAVIVRGLGEGLSKGPGTLARQLAALDSARRGQVLVDMLESARKCAGDDAEQPAARVDAIRLLSLGTFADAGPLLGSLVSNQQPQAVQSAALGTLARFSDPSIAQTIIDAWPSLSPRLRAEATEAIFSRSEWLLALLAAAADGKLSLGDLDPARIRLLEKHADATVRERAAPLVAKIKLGRRQDVVDAYRDTLSADGDRSRGRQVFQKTCAACHRLEGVGHEIGPNLASFRNRGAEAMLVNVLDPNREVNPQYVNYVLHHARRPLDDRHGGGRNGQQRDAAAGRRHDRHRGPRGNRRAAQAACRSCPREWKRKSTSRRWPTCWPTCSKRCDGRGDAVVRILPEQPVTRRAFCRLGVAAGLGASLAAERFAQADASFPAGKYVDVHTHLGQTWNSTEVLTADELLRWMDANEIAQAVVLPLVSPESSSYPLTTDFVLAETKPHRERLIPFCSVDPRTSYRGGLDGLVDMLKRYVDEGAKGFGEHKPGVAIDDPRNMTIYAACGELKLPLLVSPGRAAQHRRAGTARARAALKEFPDTRFIGHGPGWWASIGGNVTPRDLAGYPDGPVAPGGAIDRLMDKYPNLYGDLSAGSGAGAISRDVEFGREFLIRRADRLMFGTDFLSPGQEVPQLTLFRTLDLPAEVQRKIFRDNARRAAGLAVTKSEQRRLGTTEVAEGRRGRKRKEERGSYTEFSVISVAEDDLTKEARLSTHVNLLSGNHCDCRCSVPGRPALLGRRGGLEGRHGQRKDHARGADVDGWLRQPHASGDRLLERSVGQGAGAGRPARHARCHCRARPGRHQPRRGRPDPRHLASRYSLPASHVAFCCSHTHSGPVVGHNLRSLHYDQVDGEQQKLIERYAERLQCSCRTGRRPRDGGLATGRAVVRPGHGLLRYKSPQQQGARRAAIACRREARRADRP